MDTSALRPVTYDVLLNMKYLLVLTTLLIFGCKKSDRNRLVQTKTLVSIEERFLERLKTDKKTVFFSERDGPHIEDRCACKIQFFPDSECLFSSYAYSFLDVRAKYSIKNKVVTIQLQDGRGFFLDSGQNFPDMILGVDNEFLTLKRKDGATHFSEHWNVYPNPKGEDFPIFPMRTREN